LAVADSAERQTEGRVNETPDDYGQSKNHGQGHIVEDGRISDDVGTSRAANAVLTAGHAGPPQAYAPYDHAQGKGQQQEVNPTDPGGQQSENAGRESRSEYTEKTTDPGRSAHDRRPVDDDVRRDAENRAVTE